MVSLCGTCSPVLANFAYSYSDQDEATQCYAEVESQGKFTFTNVIPVLTLYMQANSRHRKIPFRGNRLYSAAFCLLWSVTTQWWHKSRFPGTLKSRKKVHGVRLVMAAEICTNGGDQMYMLVCACEGDKFDDLTNVKELA